MEDFAPLSYQEPYDNAGLILGYRDTLLSGVMICLDVSEAVIDEALECGCNLIISHHPLIFKGIKSVTSKNHVEHCLVKAIKNDVSVYAGHTNVDAVCNGVSGVMAKKLGLLNSTPLVPCSSANSNECGLGMVGDLPHPENEDAFLRRVKDVFGCRCLRHSKPMGREIRRVAVCGGAGSAFLTQANSAGADVFITGEARFHEFFTEGINALLVDAGHYETEQFIKEVFFELISKKFPTFAVRVSKKEKNPVYYL